MNAGLGGEKKEKKKKKKKDKEKDKEKVKRSGSKKKRKVKFRDQLKDENGQRQQLCFIHIVESYKEFFASEEAVQPLIVKQSSCFCYRPKSCVIFWKLINSSLHLLVQFLLPLGFCLHQSQVFLQDYPHMDLIVKRVTYDEVHVHLVSVLVAHSLRKAGVLVEEMLVPV